MVDFYGMITNHYSETDLATETDVLAVCPYRDEKSRSAFAEGYRAALILESVRACGPLLLRLQTARQEGKEEIRWRDCAMGMPGTQAQTTLQLLEADGYVEQWLRKAKRTGAGKLGLYIRILRDLPDPNQYAAQLEKTLLGSEVQESLSLGSEPALFFFNPSDQWEKTRLNPLNERVNPAAEKAS